MYKHHEETIQRLRQRFEGDQLVIALIIIGSIARNEAMHDSDIDFYLVVTDEAYTKQQAAGNVSVSFDKENANGGLTTIQYLTEAATKAPEPTRFAYTKAIIVFSKEPTIQDLINKIQEYPENERAEKMISFVSQLPIHLSYLHFGEYSKNPYVLAETAVKLVLFGGRLILAHNRLLYPSRKQFFKQIERAKDKPENFLTLATTLLQHPSIVTAHVFYDAVMNFRAWEQPKEGYMERYTRDTRQGSLDGNLPIEEV
jgi:hypothetical protein